MEGHRSDCRRPLFESGALIFGEEGEREIFLNVVTFAGENGDKDEEEEEGRGINLLPPAFDHLGSRERDRERERTLSFERRRKMD